VSLLPPADNDYRGSPLALWFLWLLVAVNAFRGCVHFLWEDSGAGRIAGIDLTANGAVIVHMLAQIGIDQLVWGAIQAATALRYRRFIPLVLLITLVKQAAGTFLLWVWKELPVAAPGKYGALVTLPLIALAFWLSLPRRGGAVRAAPRASPASVS
jgi:hypothetical protein